jgi:hypothetical protein
VLSIRFPVKNHNHLIDRKASAALPAAALLKQLPPPAAAATKAK